MTFVLALGFALALQAALTAPEVFWLFSPMHVWLVVVVAKARGQAPGKAGWFGLAAGLGADLVRGLPLGPAAIAGVFAAGLVAKASVVFELAGPLFWVVSTLAGSMVTEATVSLIYVTLGAPPPHGLVGSAAAVAGTSLLGLVAAFFEWWWQRQFSPQARRRRALRRR